MSDCCSIAVILYSWERFHISNKGQASASFMISLTHSVILTPTHTQTLRKRFARTSYEGERERHRDRNKRSDDIDKKSARKRQRETRCGTQSTGVLEGWVTAYLFGMMKIFPSRQPFVALVPRTGCQICFSSQSCLHTAAIMHTSTHTVCLPIDHNRCAAV